MLRIALSAQRVRPVADSRLGGRLLDDGSRRLQMTVSEGVYVVCMTSSWSWVGSDGRWKWRVDVDVEAAVAGVRVAVLGAQHAGLAAR